MVRDVDQKQMMFAKLELLDAVAAPAASGCHQDTGPNPAGFLPTHAEKVQMLLSHSTRAGLVMMVRLLLVTVDSGSSGCSFLFFGFAMDRTGGTNGGSI